MKFTGIISTGLVCLAAVLMIAGCRSESERTFVAVNQVGYIPADSKQALLVDTQADTFEIVKADGDSVVYRGEIGRLSRPDSSTGDRTAVIDFTGFTETGMYVIRTDTGDKIVRSEPFYVDDQPYKQAMLESVQSFYYNRCGVRVDNGTQWKHPACHTDDAVFYSDTTRRRDVTGGWHDAGDYGKFTINTALSAGLLLYLYELHPGMFDDGQLNNRDRNNGIPDLLDEVKWALEWLLKMQENSGGVFHKVSQKKWVGEYLPHEDPETRYIFEVSSNATAGFTGVTALAARLYKPYDSSFSERLAVAAEKAWGYLDEHPRIQPPGGFSNPPDVLGGAYSDEDDIDVRLWASVEMYKMTGDARYLDYFAANYEAITSGELPPLGWKDFHMLALNAFIEIPLPADYKTHRQTILQKFKNEAARLLRLQARNSYRTLLDVDDYYWGSAGANLGNAFLLIQLHRQTAERKYYDAALEQLHYTLGRNPFNRTFITGVGSVPVESPYHQFSMEADFAEPVRGMMVGGPNNHRQLQGRGEISGYPGKNYEDDEKNFFVNEVAINYTAIFAYTAGYFTSDNQEVKSTHELEQ